MTDSAATTAGVPDVTHVLGPIEMFNQADIVVKTVMILLILASAWSWGIIITKSIYIGFLERRAKRLLRGLKDGVATTEISPSFDSVSLRDPLRLVYQAMVDENIRSSDLRFTVGQQESLLDRIHRVAQLANLHAQENVRSGLQTLATVGAIAPFVGLFGTVWGIMRSFQGIAATNNTSLAVVAPGIAEALFATALGLAAAIPAVVFYNRVSGNISRYSKNLTTLIGIYEVELSRQLAKGETHGRRAA